MSWDIGRYGDVVQKDGSYSVLVVGAGSGIGKASAEFLARQGATVVCADRDKAAAETIAQTIGDRASALALDIADAAAARKALAGAEKNARHFHAVVNCAGITGRTNIKGHEVDLANFDEVHQINLRGALILSQAVLPGMLARGYGRILHVASIAGKEGNAGMTAYSATKAGLIGFSKSLAAELAPDVRVNVVAPGVTNTPMAAFLFQGYNNPNDAPWVKQYALQRIAEPIEIAQAVLFLTSAESSYVTGIALAADGGRTFH